MAVPSDAENPIRKQLLQAAAELLSEHGPDAVTTRKVAAEVGSSTMAVYTYFGSKQNLLGALYREAFTRFGERLGEVPQTADPLHDLRQLTLAYRGFALDNPHFYEVMFGVRRRAIEPDIEDVAFALSTFTVLADAVQRCIDHDFVPGPAYPVAQAMWAAIHGAVSLELVMPDEYMPFADGAVFSQLVDTVLAGFARLPRRS